MKPEDFSEATPGKLIRTIQGHWAFVPGPLPPRLDFSLTALSSLSEADRALGQLAAVGQGPPNPQFLLGSFLRREAVLSSRIEGTLATAEELLLFEVAPEEEPRPPDVQEVRNYVRALDHGLTRIKSLPMSLRLLRELHAVLMAGVRGEGKQPGEFRNRQNYIARAGAPIEEAIFVPPPPADMNLALDQFEKYLHGERIFPPLVDLALIHYQFEAIHPFLDGNGRVGRLLISLLLCERGHLPQPLLYLSAFFERRRDDYLDLLRRVSQEGAWMDWILFFLDGVAEQSRDAVLRSTRLLELRETYRRRMQSTHAPARVLQLVDGLFAHPAITMTGAKNAMGVKTFHTARAAVDKLIDAGILRERTGRARGRIYVATEILAVIESNRAEAL